MKRYETRFWGEETSERIGKSGASDVWKRGEVKTTVAQMCLTLCVPKDYMVHGTPQARTLGWVAFPFSSILSHHRDWAQVFCIEGWFFANWATREAQEYWNGWPIPSTGVLPNPGIQPVSPALQVDALQTELSEKPYTIQMAYNPFHFLVCNLSVASYRLLY